MRPVPDSARRWVPSLAAAGIIGVLFLSSRQPRLAPDDARGLAARFQFEKNQLPELSGYSHKTDRPVHPSLRHISRQINFTGAAVAIADLDGDGLPNDLVYVDPRIDQIIVAPAPQTGSRYQPFPLTAAPLAYDAANMAPMGCLVGDFDEDGHPDILAYYWGRSPVLFEQSRHDSEDATAVLSADSFTPLELVEPHQRWYTSAATQADLDGDGHLDLILGSYFQDGARILDAGAKGSEEMVHSASRAFNGGRDRLFLWDEAGHRARPTCPFREAADVLDDAVACGWTLALGAADLDGDLLPEIYLVNDFGPDRLLHNRSQPGKLQFALLHGERTLCTPRSKVLGGDSFNGMGVDFGDLNGDGLLDIFVSNITCPFAFLQSSFTFISTGQVDLMKSGVAPYRDESESLGLARGGWTWEARLADFNNDGDLEAMQAAGFLKGSINRWPEYQELAVGNDELTSSPRVWPDLREPSEVNGSDHNPFFVRHRDGRFYDVAAEVGMAEPMLCRGIATADVDGDGRLDFAVANQWGPSFLFHNVSPNAGAFLGLNLRVPVGPGPPAATVVQTGLVKTSPPSRPAIGASAVLHLPDGRRLVGQVDGGTGHSGKRSPDLHFGLGRLDDATPLRVDLRWRGGDGRIRAQTLSLTSGWHTVFLGEVPQGRDGDGP